MMIVNEARGFMDKWDHGNPEQPVLISLNVDHKSDEEIEADLRKLKEMGYPCILQYGGPFGKMIVVVDGNNRPPRD